MAYMDVTKAGRDLRLLRLGQLNSNPNWCPPPLYSAVCADGRTTNRRFIFHEEIYNKTITTTSRFVVHFWTDSWRSGVER